MPMQVKYSIGQQGMMWLMFMSAVFCETVHLIGNSPFEIMEHEQVKKVFCHLPRH